MSAINNLFPQGLKKAFTLSYDDGVDQDKRLLGMFNQYRLKATFNLNSGLQTEKNSWVSQGKTIKRINADELNELYRGHEVAVHGLTHPWLDNLPRESILNEILEDRKNLERIVGYPVRGMAYPYGTYNERVLEVLRFSGIEYSRTVAQHGTFALPQHYLEWHPTCHHDNPKIMELAQQFIDASFPRMSLFYVWGHSYEFEVKENWEHAEEFCRLIGGKEDIWYATNIEIVDYLKALDQVKYSADCSLAYNPTALSVWVSVDGQPLEIKPGETAKLADKRSGAFSR